MRQLLVMACVAGTATLASAQGRSTSAGATMETAHLVLTTSASAAAVAPGGRVSLYVDIAPKPKMHVYSPEQKDVIPVSLTLAAGEFKAHQPVLPKPEKYFFQPLNETQLVYSKPFRIAQEVTTAPAPRGRAAVPGASLSVTGTLRYQACDDAICYVPVTVPVKWTIVLKGAAGGR
jgi:hypothetical protein